MFLGSGNHSPRARQSVKPVSTNTNYHQRNQSPRSLNGETKLRPGVTARSANRNSANLPSSTLQEELLRLINPDNIEPSETSLKVHKENNKTHSRWVWALNFFSNLTKIVHFYRDNLNNTLSIHKPNQQEVILTTARPATVISNASTASSPLPTEFRVSKDDTLPSPSKNKVIFSINNIA